MSRAVACRYDFVRAAEGIGAALRGESGEAADDGAALLAWVALAWLPESDPIAPYDPTDPTPPQPMP